LKDQKHHGWENSLFAIQIENENEEGSSSKGVLLCARVSPHDFYLNGTNKWNENK